MSGLTIRPAGTTDIPAIIAVQRQTWWVTYESIIGKEQCDDMFERLYSEASLTAQMEESGHRFCLLERAGEPYGFASWSELDDNGLYKLQKIYVVPSAQGSGAGRCLLSAVEDFIASEGGSEIRLNVNRHNPARSFYEKMGYSVLYEEDIPIGPFWMNDYVMGKKLTVK